VLQRIGVGKTTFYCWIKEGRFPEGIPLGGHMVGWLDTDVDNWIADRVRERRGESAARAV
jgi:prophage regulatory protein